MDTYDNDDNNGYHHKQKSSGLNVTDVEMMQDILDDIEEDKGDNDYALTNMENIDAINDNDGLHRQYSSEVP